MIPEFLQQVFGNYSITEFSENVSDGCRVVPCRQTDGQTDMQTDMTKKIVYFFAIL